MSQLICEAAEIRFGITLGVSVSPDELLQQYDAVYFGIGRDDLGVLPFVDYDIATLQAQGNEKAFVGGSWLESTEGGYKSIQSAASGRQAAISIDRMLQEALLLTANRGKEGVYKSQLYTNLEWHENKLPVVAGGNRYSREEARQEAARCISCRCLCRLYSSEFLTSIRRVIKPVVINVIITPVWGKCMANNFINSCNVCGFAVRCVPPILIWGTLIQEARRMMWEMEYMPPALHDFPLRDMEYCNHEGSLLLHQKGTSKVICFSGVQLGATMPTATRKPMNF